MLNDLLSPGDQIVEASKSEKSLAISGNTVDLAFSQNDTTKKLIKLLNLCTSVIVYRCSPDDKASVISKVTAFDPNTFSVAIGDGGNDVNMI